MVIDWSLKCDCSGKFTGDYCDMEKQIIQRDTVTIMVILLCVVAGIILLLVIIPLVTVRVMRGDETYNNIFGRDKRSISSRRRRSTPARSSRKATTITTGVVV